VDRTALFRAGTLQLAHRFVSVQLLAERHRHAKGTRSNCECVVAARNSLVSARPQRGGDVSARSTGVGSLSCSGKPCVAIRRYYNRKSVLRRPLNRKRSNNVAVHPWLRVGRIARVDYSAPHVRVGRDSRIHRQRALVRSLRV
jgi:hypothetical protein